MIRILAVAGAVLAFAGAAQAQDQIVVTTVGKSPRVVQAELYRAAWTVCSTDSNPLDRDALDDCTTASLEKAMLQFRRIQKTEAAVLQTSSR